MAAYKWTHILCQMTSVYECVHAVSGTALKGVIRLVFSIHPLHTRRDLHRVFLLALEGPFELEEYAKAPSLDAATLPGHAGPSNRRQLCSS